MTKVIIVRHKQSNALIPFQLVGPYNEIQIVSSGVFNPDDYIISFIDTRHIDWDAGYVVEEEVGIGEE